MRKASNLIKRADMFGYPIGMNFNNEGSVY